MQQSVHNPRREKFDRITRLIEAGDLEEAEQRLETLRKLAPRDLNLLNLAAYLAGLRGEAQRAAALYKQVVAQAPDQPQLRFNLHRAEAIAAEQSEDLPGAVTALQKIISLTPGDESIQAQIALLERQLCLFTLPRTWRVPISPAAAMVLLPEPAAQRKNAEAWAAQQFRAIAPLPTTTPRAEPLPLRLGFLSSDFHDHATSYLTAELFTLFDRQRFEVWLYSYGRDDGSPIRRRLQREAPHFTVLQDLPPRSVADRIRTDGIDILIDLKGHTRGGRLDILAYRPAPLQLHWLGFPGTLGCPFIDYFVADPTVLPSGPAEHFSEKILYLPNSYQCNDRQKPLPPALPRSAYGLPEQGVVFASFNQSYKLHPELLTLWAEILRAVPDSVLWLLASNRWAPEKIKSYFAAAGIAPERLHFAAPTNQHDHLQRYHSVDVALDSFPIGGHTTTSDALWLGVPVVTLAGDSFVSRVAASLLGAVELPMLVAASPSYYRALAVKLAQDASQRQRIRDHLTTNRLRLPLFDSAAFAKCFMNGLDLAWARHRQGLPPANLTVA